MVFLLRDPSDGNDYVLLGNRSAGKKDFPGALAVPGGRIKEFESPVNAVLRVFRLEAGIQIKLVSNAGEPADVRLPQLGNRPEKLWFTGIYASPDTRVNGTRGGGSQCFAVYTEAGREAVEPLLFSRHDMENLRFVPVKEIPGMDLAFQQKDMVTDTLRLLDINYLKDEYLAVYTPDGIPTGEKVLRGDAHKTGVWHAASHIYVCRKNAAGETEILLQRRSHSKDTYADKLDTSSAGHVEAGMGFPDTAVKELGEELGLTVSPEELAFAFDRTVDHTWDEHGKTLTDREYDRVYLLWLDVPAESLQLQKEEVSEAVWMTAKEIARRVAEGDEEICTNKDEIADLMEHLKK
jgi:8-oxo-dGTP pyrophosphatase MutT (NUDIX family)